MPTIPWTTPKDVSGRSQEAEVVVMASRFDLHTVSQVPAFLVAALRIRRQMLSAPGVLGVSLVARPLSKTFFTLSAWQDRDTLDAAVARQPHEQAMAHFHARMAGSHFVFWTAPASDLPPSWTDALTRIEASDERGERDGERTR